MSATGDESYVYFALADNGIAKVVSAGPFISMVLFESEEPTPALKGAGEPNALRIVRRGERVRLFVNDAKVYEVDQGWTLGSRIGMYVEGDVEVEFDNLKITVK